MNILIDRTAGIPYAAWQDGTYQGKVEKIGFLYDGCDKLEFTTEQVWVIVGDWVRNRCKAVKYD